MNGGHLVMTGLEEAREHSPEVEIDKVRLGAQQKRTFGQHAFKGRQLFRQAVQPMLLLGAPKVQAAPAELSLLVAQKGKLVLFRHELLVINIVEAETRPFHLILNDAPNKTIYPAQLLGEKIQLELGVEVFGDDLGVFLGLKNDRAAIAHNGNAVITVASQTPDQGAFRVGDIGNFKTNT